MTVCLMYILLAGTMKENINPSYHKFKPSMNINRFLDFFLTLSDKKGFFYCPIYFLKPQLKQIFKRN